MERRTVTPWIALIAATLGLLVGASGSAMAITNGEIDGDRHPNVGVVGCTTQTDVFATTAYLISPTVVLTAGHATSFFLAPEVGCVSYFASFDPIYTANPKTTTFLAATTVVTHPGFDFSTFENDVGVFILKKPVKGITPVQLPTAGLLDQLKAEGTLQDQTFVTVGYGATADCSGGPCSYSDDTTRKFTTERFSSLGPGFINFQENTTATGEGGTCFGDSGGPHFLGTSNLSVGVTSTGAPWQGPNACRAVAFVQRLDIPSVRAFLARFVALP